MLLIKNKEIVFNNNTDLKKIHYKHLLAIAREKKYNGYSKCKTKEGLINFLYKKMNIFQFGVLVLDLK